MIKSVYACPEETIKHLLEKMAWKAPFSLPESWALISIQALPREVIIQNSVQKKFLQKMGCHSLMQPVFGDISLEEYQKIHSKPGSIGYEQVKDVPVLTPDLARHIVNFIDEVNKSDIETLIVQCHAGVSRSGAVATFACRYLGLDEEKFRADNKYIHPKDYIYDVLIEVSGLRGDFDRFWDHRGHDIDARIIFT